ncbi:MAG: hypothetical protein QGG84_09690, partial [Rhodospirillales bacterium]|nr:hypothetical protein [Rhodospirillales bacterium]
MELKLSDQPLSIGNLTGVTNSGFIGLIDDVRIYNRALSETEVVALYELEKPKTALEAGLIAYYPFNGNANDESGNGNDGTVNGATLAADRNGETGKAYSFDGASHIEVNSSNIDF